MWSLLGTLISNFLLLRDLFGYVIPGAALLALAHFGFSNQPKLPLADQSAWLQLVVAITASYVVGHVLAAIGYTLYENTAVAATLDRVSKWNTGKDPTKADPEKNPDKLYFRYLYPSMYTEVDRRDTLTILRVGLSIALIVAPLFPSLPLVLRVLFPLLGLFMFWNGYLSKAAAEDYSDATLLAAQRAKRDDIPIFHWSGGSDSDNDGDVKPKK